LPAGKRGLTTALLQPEGVNGIHQRGMPKTTKYNEYPSAASSILLLTIPDKLLKNPIIIEEINIYLRIVTLSNCSTNLHSTSVMIVDMIHTKKGI
jgi:hypothetical protein